MRDYPVLQAEVLLFSLEFILINLLVDILYAVINHESASSDMSMQNNVSVASGPQKSVLRGANSGASSSGSA